MKVIAPITITEAMLTSSTLAETEYTDWNSGTGYTTGARVRRAHQVWESVSVGTNTNHDPVTDTTSTWWVRVGPTNRWAMFDNSISTASNAAVDIEVQITPATIVDSLAIIAGIGDTVRVQMHDGATSVYDQTLSLDSTPILDWDDYFFDDFVLAGELIFENLPSYLYGVITVTITAASGEAAVGALVLGRMHDLGGTQRGAGAGFTDYSVAEESKWGDVTLEKGAFARRNTIRFTVPRDELRRVEAVVASLRGAPAVWIGSSNTARYPLVVYGWCRNFDMDLNGERGLSFCTLEVRGLPQS